MNHFGTDGIRAKAEVFTKDYIERIAKAALIVKPQAKVVIGRDTRESGLDIENKLSDAILKYGGEVVVVGMTATPVLAFLTKKLEGDYGIMISASHNPPEYNGIKFFGSTAEKITDETESRIDFHIDNYDSLKKVSDNNYKQYYYGDNDYIEYLTLAIKPNIKGMKICLDCANGGTSEVAPLLFASLGAEITVFNKNVTGKDINEGCGATMPEFLLKKMEKGNYDIGFSYDGDGDRLMAVSEGKLFDGDQLMYVHGLIMKKENKLNNNTIVGTIMSNMGMEVACRKAGINLVRTDVGDKFVHREMIKNGYNIGGEQSGHIIFSDYMKTGDGILASLLTAILAKNYSLKDLDDIEEYPKSTESYMCSKETADRFRQDKEIQDYLKNLKFEGRAVVRPSGTEPKIRIMVEAKDKHLAEDKAREIKDFLIWRLG